jgi:hypothetical protein
VGGLNLPRNQITRVCVCNSIRARVETCRFVHAPLRQARQSHASKRCYGRASASSACKQQSAANTPGATHLQPSKTAPGHDLRQHPRVSSSILTRTKKLRQRQRTCFRTRGSKHWRVTNEKLKGDCSNVRIVRLGSELTNSGNKVGNRRIQARATRRLRLHSGNVTLMRRKNQGSRPRVMRLEGHWNSSEGKRKLRRWLGVATCLNSRKAGLCLAVPCEQTICLTMLCEHTWHLRGGT